MNVDRYRIKHGDRRGTTRYRPDDTGPFRDKRDAASILKKGVERLGDLQDLMYAVDRHAMLLIFQGMDTAGKDGAIKHVMAGVHPQGTEVHAFKVPSAEERDHDFLWRAARVLPERGRIGIFNRSYYEDVLVVRVHPEQLESAHLPPDRVSRSIWEERFESINDFERHLWRNGTIVLKFFLNISRREQRRRLLSRLDDPAKNWKFSPGDVVERARWDAYQEAYRDAIAATSHEHAPWYVVPADHKWFARAVVAGAIVQALERLDLAYPRPTPAEKRALVASRKALSKPGG